MASKAILAWKVKSGSREARGHFPVMDDHTCGLGRAETVVDVAYRKRIPAARRFRPTRIVQTAWNYSIPGYGS